MSLVVGAYDPEDWRGLVKRGAVLTCAGGGGFYGLRNRRESWAPTLCERQVTVQKAGEVPAGWVILREKLAPVDGYSLSAYCPECDPVYKQ